MKPTILHALARLSTKPARSSIELSNSLNVSQQTASRWLIRLASEGLVEKAGAYRITAKGNAHLAAVFGGGDRSATIEGTVFTGLGEGKYYLARKGYRQQFQRLLGFTPYSGTLNLRLDTEEAKEANRKLRAGDGLRIRGFTEEQRTFGGARCYKALIQNKAMGAVIVPERAHYAEDVVELLSAENLRRSLRVKDGSRLSVKIPESM